MGYLQIAYGTILLHVSFERQAIVRGNHFRPFAVYQKKRSDPGRTPHTKVFQPKVFQRRCQAARLSRLSVFKLKIEREAVF
ncbi:MAG TPA: hypothetical protein DEB39_11510 [Planctomycetaceae bacterium]|nr:hypothetical protein [Planctomycetaceae bacterium]